MKLANSFFSIAHYWHNVVANQKRKYTGHNYTVHTTNVASIFASFFPDDEIGIAAAYGHDIFEDCGKFGANYDVITRQAFYLLEFKDNRVLDVLHLIDELTDVFTSENFPKINRAGRKELERERLSKISKTAQNIKVCDLIDNTFSIVQHDPGFAKTYLQEKRNLLSVLTEADPRLIEIAYSQIQ